MAWVSEIKDMQKFELYFLGLFIASFSSSIPLFILNNVEFGLAFVSLSMISLNIFLFSPIIRKLIKR